MFVPLIAWDLWSGGAYCKLPPSDQLTGIVLIFYHVYFCWEKFILSLQMFEMQANNMKL